MKYFQQLDETDCGAACLAMIASYFGKELNIANIRNLAGTDVIGTNVWGLVKAASQFKLRATPLKGTKDSFSKQLPVPFIAHLNIISSESEWCHHFVVVRKITNKKVEIWDPDPCKKKRIISLEKFFEWWTGYVIFFEPEEDFEKDKSKNNFFIKFIPIFLPHRKIILYTFLSSIIIMIFGLISSFYFKYIFDEVIFANSKTSLFTLSFCMILVVIIQCVISSIRSVFLSHLSFKTDLQLTFSYLSHIFKLPISFFESRKSGEILSRLNDLEKVKNTISNVALSTFMDIMMILISVPFLVKISSTLFLISFFTVVLASLIAFFYSKIYRSFYSKIMTENAEVQSYLFESINGVSTVKALNAETIIHGEYEKRKMKSVSTGWKVNKIGISQGFISEMLNGLSSILVYWIGVSAIISGKISLGTLITFNSLVGYFSGPLFRIINLQNDIQESLIAARRVGEVLELDREYIGSENEENIKKIEGNIVFENVSFRYGSRLPVYENLSLDINMGQWIAFVGPSGSGKSTLAKLLLKFYHIEDGRISIDGKNINDISSGKLRELIGYVPQEIFLFSGTIKDNIAMHNPNASTEEIIEAAKKAGADEFIEKLSKRYETLLGEHGGGLSGGEKQRIALARALLGNPSLLILDEATSNLDVVSERQIHEVIKNLKKEKMTVILIAHRLSTVVDCDQIFVMEKGNIVEKGTHEELLKNQGLYSEMWKDIC